MNTRFRSPHILVGLVATLVATSSALGAQGAAGATSALESFVGSDMEAYLRTLSVAVGRGRLQWSIREHSPRELSTFIKATSAERHAWHDRVERDAPRWRRIQLIVPTLGVRYNSAFPYGVQDGAVWAGRGITTVAQAGVTARWGSLGVRLVPVWFRASNASHSLMRLAGDTGVSPFADGVWPYQVDAPQRFGADPYGRLDLGQSAIRVDTRWASAGITTANESWGPGTRFAYILSANAGGFPRLFAGTEALPIGIGRVQTKFLWGQLQQSRYSPAPDSARLRYAVGGAFLFQPRYLDGLEVGVARFFHERWPERGLRGANFALPFEGLIKSPLPADSAGNAGDRRPSNQLASLFARWTIEGAEVYMEVGREDHGYDRRDLIVEPDHIASLMTGAQRSWQRPGVLRSIQVEAISYRANRLVIHRLGPATYIHGNFPQGHTQRGQLLGADAGIGAGSGLEASYTSYRAHGRDRYRISRVIRYSDRVNQRLVWTPLERDQIYAISAERLRFARLGDLSLGFTAAINLNRNFERDVFNLNTSMSWTPSLGVGSPR